MRNVRITIWVVAVLMVSWLCESMQAGTIIQDQIGHTRQILHYSPIGQTFTAEDEYIQSIGFWLEDFNPGSGPMDITIELFRGEGIGGPSLGSAPVEGLYPGFNSFFDANFDFVRLEVGQKYSAIVTSTSARGGMASFQWAYTNGTPFSPDPYTGGDLIVQGQIIDYYDAAFRVAFIPEPTTLLLLGLGAFVVRRKR